MTLVELATEIQNAAWCCPFTDGRKLTHLEVFDHDGNVLAIQTWARLPSDPAVQSGRMKWVDLTPADAITPLPRGMVDIHHLAP